MLLGEHDYAAKGWHNINVDTSIWGVGVLEWHRIFLNKYYIRINYILEFFFQFLTFNNKQFQINRSTTLFSDDVVEFLEIEVVMSLGSVHNVCIVHHFCKFVIIHCLSEFSSNSFEAIKVSEPISLLIPDLENFSNPISWFTITNLWANNVQKLFELDRSVNILESINHVKNDGASSLET